MASNTPEHRYPTNYGISLSGQGKVAIPRLQRLEQRQGEQKDRRRVPRACTGVSLNRARVSNGSDW